MADEIDWTDPASYNTPLPYETQDDLVNKKTLVGRIAGIPGAVFSGAQSAVLGAASAIPQAIGDVTETATELATQFAIGGGATALEILGIKPDEDAAFETYDDVMKAYDKYIGVHTSPEDDPNDPIYTFTKNAGSSLIKFMSVHGRLAKMGVGTIKAGAAAGLFEGFTDDPERNEGLLATEENLRAAVKAIAPDALADFEAAFSETTNNMAARRNLRRVINAIEMSTLSTALDTGAVLVKSGLKSEAAKPVVEGAKRAFEKTAISLRAAKESMMAAKQKPGSATYIKAGDTTAEDIVSKADDFVADPKKPIKENVRNAIKVEFDSSYLYKSADDYSDKFKAYQEKLSELAPKIYDDIVSMAKVKGVEAESMLRNYAKELGEEEAHITTKEGFAKVLATQAHNILLEQEGIKFGLSYKNYKSGAISKDDFLESIDSFIIARTQRKAPLSVAGRIFRTSQEGKMATRLEKAYQVTNEAVEAGLERLQIEISESAQKEAFGEALARTLNLKNILELDEDAYTEALIRSVSNNTKAAAKEKEMGIALQLADTVARSAQGALLTGTRTITQNSLGTATMQTVRGIENYISWGLQGPGSRTLKEANAYMVGLMTGYGHSIKSLFHVLKHSGSDNSTLNAQFKQEAGDLSLFDKRVAKEYFDVSREETQGAFEPTGNALYDHLQKSTAGRVGTSSWALRLVGMQDTLGKSASAVANMKASAARALYVDDVFDLKSHPGDLLKAQQVVSNMIHKGHLKSSRAELDEYFGDRAGDISTRIEQWRATATEDSFEMALKDVFQEDLSPAMEKTRRFLQDTIPGGRLFTPFFATPVNIYSQAFERLPVVPLGEGVMGLPIHPKFYKEYMNPQTRNQAASKAIMGTMLSYAGYHLAEAGGYQGVPISVEESKTLSITFGIIPGSFKVGDNSVASASLGPPHLGLSLGAGIYQNREIINASRHWDDDKHNQLMDGMAYRFASIGMTIAESPVFTGPENILNIMQFANRDWLDEEEVKRAANEFGITMGRQLGNALPSSALNRQLYYNLIDDDQRRAQGFYDQFLGTIFPWMTSSKTYDPYGDPVDANSGWFFTKKEMVPLSLKHEFLDEVEFMPPDQKFKIVMQARIGGESLPVLFNLAEHGLWDEYNEIRAQGMGAALQNVRDTEEYRDHLKNISAFGPRLEKARTLLQSRMDAKNNQAIEILRLKYPMIDSILIEDAQKKIVNKQTKRPIATIRPDEPQALPEVVR